MNIKFVVFDFDGVFTNGECYFYENDIIGKYYNVKDGMALKILNDHDIKTGLISSYSNIKKLEFNKLNLDKTIANHLKFDYKYIGKTSKIDILDKWLNDMNISYENVAYIGDDINDIDILKNVGYSACPNDAVNKCKEVVGYICKKNGGEGCVREFVENIINYQNENGEICRIIQEIKHEFNYQINNFDLKKIYEFVNIIKKNKGLIHCCGIGKSGNIAKHFCDLLKCISYKSYNFDILNCNHGDIGAVENDLIIIFSNSGNSQEVINIIPNLKQKNQIIGISCNNNAKFNDLCHYSFVTPYKKEISGEINKIPTNSYMSHLIFCNITISILKNDISLNEYSQNHLSGDIGKQLKKINDILITKYPKIVIDVRNFKVDINYVLLEMTKYSLGCCFFIDKTDKLIGIITDGDIRRILLKNKNVIEYSDINTKFYFETDIFKHVSECCKKYVYVPVIVDSKLRGIFTVYDYNHKI